MKEKNNSDYIYCSKCGKKNSIRDNFCTNCGNSLKSLEESVKNKADEFRETIRNSKTYKEFTDTSYQDTYISDFDNKDMINFIQKLYHNNIISAIFFAKRKFCFIYNSNI